MQASAQGLIVGYDEAGSGTPLLLLHGFPLNRRMWQPQLAALAGLAHCIAPDVRGFGDSDIAPPFTIDQFADDAISLLDAVGVTEPAVVCGLSMGGYIAFAIWRRHRDRVRALILADTRATADTEEAKVKRREVIETVRARGSGAIAESQARAMLSARTLERCPEALAEVQAMITSQRPEAIAGANEAMLARPDSTLTLATIAVPTLILVGEHDAITPPAISEEMQRAIPNSRLERLSGAGHLSSFERPAAFNGAVAELLETVS
ncbi:MAG TPA: alpha/beta fold hydrolase [Gemmatimonadaceae bacterium]|nr:alpha/beta fold hydrolase [Gemmatimonadaceae bacterium]